MIHLKQPHKAEGEIVMESLIKDAFYHLNGFKMYRAKCETARNRGDEATAQENELKMYKAIDQLELSLRGIQRSNRESGDE